MFRPNKLLKVVSIILIVLGALAIVTTIIGYAGAKSLSNTNIEGVDMSVLQAAYTPLNLAIALGTSLILVICGILGVMGKAFLISMGLMVIYIILDIVSNVIAGAVWTPMVIIMFVIGLILPILYLWGLYQSK